MAAFVTGKVFQPLFGDDCFSSVFSFPQTAHNHPGIVTQIMNYVNVSISHESYVGSYLVLNLIMGLNKREINADFRCCLATFWFF